MQVTGTGTLGLERRDALAVQTSGGEGRRLGPGLTGEQVLGLRGAHRTARHGIDSVGGRGAPGWVA